MKATRSFDVTYKDVDFEIIPSKLISLGGGSFWPPREESIRLKLSNYVPAMILISSSIIYYFVLVPYVFPAMKPAPSEGSSAIKRCKTMRDMHNLLLCLYSGTCCFSTAYYLYYVRDGQLFDWEALLCEPVEGTWLRPLSMTFTLSKLVEWIDTAFIIWLGRSPPAFLHKYHHATTFWLFCFVPNLPGPEKFGLLLNGFVHFLMYSHYYKSWPKPIVPMITVLQILQLSLVTYAWTVTPTVCPDSRFAKAASDHPIEFMTPYGMVPVFLYLFILFFVKRFILRKPKRQGIEKQKKNNEKKQQ